MAKMRRRQTVGEWKGYEAIYFGKDAAIFMEEVLAWPDQAVACGYFCVAKPTIKPTTDPGTMIAA